MEQTYFRKGFGLRKELRPVIDAEFKSALVEQIRSNGNRGQFGDVSIRLANKFGFCYGVDRAVDYAYETVHNFPEKKIYLVGEIIHNPYVNQRMIDMGISFIYPDESGIFDFSRITPKDVAVMPAFGVTLHDFDELKNIGCILVDTTCGSVLHVWKRVESYAKDGFTAVIHGKDTHEESRATASQVHKFDGGRFIIIRDMDESKLICDYIADRPGKMSREEFMTHFEKKASDGFDPDVDLEFIGVANQTTMLANESLAIGWKIHETMVEHFGSAAYQTGVFTSNPFAVTMSGLERGVDFVRVEDVEVQATSSEFLHDSFFEWREAYPGQPYWAHFQTTDVHEPFRPQAPFAGLFIDPERRERYIEWDDALGEMPGGFFRPENYEPLGITVEPHALAQQALYDEGMAHQDHHLRRLVARLKASGQWENTILVIASDHGYPAGSHRFMPGMDFEAPIVHPYATRVPLLFVAPGRIAGGRRVATPVSMIDVMPTLLDLAGLPPLEVQQGRSLAALLRGEIAELAPRPVFIEKLGQESQSGSLVGTIGVIDGRWAASLLLQDQRAIPEESMPRHGDGNSDYIQRTERLLLWDREADPLMARSVHEEYPDLVGYYETMLEEHVEANAAIARLFGGGGDVELSAGELEILRTLGYIR